MLQATSITVMNFPGLSQIANLFVLTVLLAGCEPDPTAIVLSLEDGWVRAVPPGMKMTAAYGRFTNHGMDTIEIISFRSDSFTDVGLHQTTMENGVSKMEQVSNWSLSPGTRTVLKPGALHLMLMDPTRKIRPGDSIGLTLIAANGEQYRFSLPVETR
jgi:hypothetical protein